MINEAVDLFDAPLARRRTVDEGDLIATLGERVERLVERHRATRRAVDELGSALVAEVARLASAGEERSS